MSANKNLIRHQNIQVALKELFQKGTSFASDLVKETGISMVTINSLLKDLVSEGMVTKGKLVQREIGRPAIEYCFNYKYSKSLLLALDRSKSSIGVEKLPHRFERNDLSCAAPSFFRDHTDSLSESCPTIYRSFR